MKRPRIDEKLTLLADFGETEAICVEVLDNPSTEEGILLKVMARGPFEQGQQIWIVDRDGSKIGAAVENVFKQTERQHHRQRSHALNRSPGVNEPYGNVCVSCSAVIDSDYSSLLCNRIAPTCLISSSARSRSPGSSPIPRQLSRMT